MASWKKVALETTAVSFSDLTLTGLSNQASEATALMIDGSNIVGTRELGANAFNSTTIPTVNDTTIDLIAGAGLTGTGAFTTNDSDAVNITFAVDIPNTTLLNAAAASDDEVLIYDTSETALKSISVSNLVSGVAGVNDTTIDIIAGNGLTGTGSFTTNDSDEVDITLVVEAADNTISVASGGISVVEGNLSGIPNSALTNSGVTIGSTAVALGATVTDFAGLTALDFTDASHTIAASMGSGSTLTLGGTDSTVLIAGDLQVTGNTETVNTTELLVEDKTVTLADGAHSAANGDASGIIVDTSATNANRANFIWKNTGIGVAGWQFKDDGASASFPDMGVAALTVGAADPTSTIMPVGSLFYNNGTSENEGLYLYTTT